MCGEFYCNIRTIIHEEFGGEKEKSYNWFNTAIYKVIGAAYSQIVKSMWIIDTSCERIILSDEPAVLH